MASINDHNTFNWVTSLRQTVMLPGRIRTKMDEERENKKMEEEDEGRDQGFIPR